MFGLTATLVLPAGLGFDFCVVCAKAKAGNSAVKRKIRFIIVI